MRNSVLKKLPARVVLSSSVTRRHAASMSASVSSATATEFTPAVMAIGMPASRKAFKVVFVHADAPFLDELELRRLLEDFRVDLVFAEPDEEVGVLDHAQQLFPGAVFHRGEFETRRHALRDFREYLGSEIADQRDFVWGCHGASMDTRRSCRREFFGMPYTSAEGRWPEEYAEE